MTDANHSIIYFGAALSHLKVLIDLTQKEDVEEKSLRLWTHHHAEKIQEFIENILDRLPEEVRRSVYCVEEQMNRAGEPKEE
jgi:hypothetical protein